MIGLVGESAGEDKCVGHGRRHRIRVVVSQVEVTLDPYEPALAQARATVALAGGERLLPNSAGVYQVESHWRNFDGEWQITRLQWR